MKSTFFIGFLVVLSCMVSTENGYLLGQNANGLWDIPRSGGESITEPSPEATAMRRYQDYPVSYATGTADISIPLLELPGGAVNVSLGLSYQVGAIKKEQIHTYVGLGWTLTGLGCVSRQIHGFPDEWRGDSDNPVSFDLRQNMSDVQYLTDIIEAKKDAETDVYSYSIPGYSGCFVILNNKIKQLPESDITIERTADTGNSLATKSFTIKTPEGLRYYFTKTESIDYQINDSPRPMYYYNRDYNNAVTAWHLTKIESPDGKDIAQITYSDYTGWTRSTQQYITSDQFKWSPIISVTPSSYTIGAGSPSGTMKTIFKNQLIPLSISTRCGRIEMAAMVNLDARYGQRVLRYIRLYDKDNTLVKTITLSNTDVSSDGRVLLTEIKTISDSKTIDRYRMEYNSLTSNNGYDLFGYANGISIGNGFHSIINSQLERSNTRRESEGTCNHGSLKSITDIMGAKTEFEYEPSTVVYSEPFREGQTFKNSVQIGTRIKKITTSGNCPERVRTFTYDSPQCNIDLSEFTYHDFMSYTGTYYAGLYQNEYDYWEYYLGISHTSSLNAKGVPLEDAKIYYGKVIEEVTGDFISSPIRTEYNYELGHTKLNIVRGSVSSPPHEDISTESGRGPVRFLGSLESTAWGIDAQCKKLMSYSSSLGYIEKKIGAAPLLKGKIYYKKGYNGFYKDKEEKYNYIQADSYRCQIGVNAESRIFKVMSSTWDKKILDLQELSDIAFYAINITGIR
ncbi:MAG: hypothetical protein K2G40_05890, partial [Muribaculaceae bacterium]|nr:hypothetical protein [Muribaculaceae bacterium]